MTQKDFYDKMKSDKKDMTKEEFNEEWKEYISSFTINEKPKGLNIDDTDVCKFLNNVFKDLTRIPGFKFDCIRIHPGSGGKPDFSLMISSLGVDMEDAIETRIDGILKEKRNKKVHEDTSNWSGSS